MMQPDPFHTPELDDLRVEQRQLLYLIPGWIADRVGDIRAKVDELQLYVDNSLNELVLRREIAVALGTNNEFADRIRTTGEAEHASATLAAIADAMPFDEPGPAISARSQAIREESPRIREHSDEESAWLRLVITMLLLADRLAGDYTDPRYKAS